VLDLPVTAGTLAELTGTGTVAVPAGSWRLGETAELWLGDSTPVRLRVVAILAEQLDLAETVLLPWQLRVGHASPLADAVYLRTTAGTGLDTVATAGGGMVISTGDYLSAAAAEQDRVNRLGLIAVLGMALLYTGIAIANTLVMATGDRARELATLRLTGATTGQVIRMVAVEAVVVTCIGVLLATAVTGVTVAGLYRAIAEAAPTAGVVIPWQTVGGISLACLVTAVLASVVPAALLLRRRPVELAGARE
jgi:putative ABC transport system permease protein